MILNSYFEAAINKLESSVEASKEDIVEVSKFIADIMLKDGVIQLFGVNHDRALPMELGFRAGGLVQYHQINIDDAILRGVITEENDNQLELLNNKGLAEKLWSLYTIEKNDALFIYVVKDVYNVTLELAKLAKVNGHPVILATSKTNILNGISKSNAEELLGLADIILELHIDSPDIFYEVDGVKVTQIANLIGNIYAQAITMEIYKYMKEKGVEAPVLWSANIEGADKHNENLTKKYDGRWNS